MLKEKVNAGHTEQEPGQEREMPPAKSNPTNSRQSVPKDDNADAARTELGTQSDPTEEGTAPATSEPPDPSVMRFNSIWKRAAYLSKLPQHTREARKIMTNPPSQFETHHNTIF